MILGVLAALVVPRVLERPDEARVVAAKADIATIMQALKLYRLDNQRYPTTRAGIAGTGREARPSAPVPAQLEAERLSRTTAEGSVGTAVSVPQSRDCAARSTSSASAPTASPAAPASTPTSARGTSEPRRRAPARAPAWLHADRNPGRARDHRGWSRDAVTSSIGGDERRVTRARSQAPRGRARARRRDARNGAPRRWDVSADGAAVVSGGAAPDERWMRARRRRRARRAHRCPRGITVTPIAYAGAPVPAGVRSFRCARAAATNRSRCEIDSAAWSLSCSPPIRSIACTLARLTARGFTLVEILVALAIVAVALAAGMRALAQATDSATR